MSSSTSQTNVGLFDGWRVIDTIAGHSNHVALALTRLNDQQLLMRDCASKDDVLMVQDDVVELHERHVCQVGAMHDNRRCISKQTGRAMNNQSSKTGVT